MCFPAETHQRAVATFSGGWRVRLNLARALMTPSDMLLLDEPTNHLDLGMREALAEALSDFPGAIVLVSHDRHLIGLVSDTFWRVSDGVVIPFDGDLDEYAAWLRARGNAGELRTPQATPAAPVGVSATPAKPATKAARVNPHKLQKAEAMVAELEQALGEIDAALADPGSYADIARVASLGQRQMCLRDELEQAEGALLALYDTV